MVEISHFLVLLCLMFLLTLSTVESLHLKLIHRDSIDSPFYPGNLTNVEKLQRLDNYSIATAQYYKTMLSQSDFNTEQLLHPRVTHDSFHYVVELRVGTHQGQPQRGQSYKFVLDTTSALMWLQCRPCQNCWKEEHRLFNGQNSAPIPCNHPLCDLNQPGWACIQNQCHYTFHYIMPKATIGVLVSDTIGFSPNPNPTEIIHPVVFGCSHYIQGNFAMPDDVDGALGLTPSPLSLISQIKKNVGGRKFAYCLSHLTSSPLKLGAFLGGEYVNTIRMRWFPGPMHVYLPLRDVSIGNRRINFAPGTFEPRRVGHSIQGGFIIDSGAEVTYFMSGGPYGRIMAAFIDYFKRRPGLVRAGRNMAFELCYHHNGGFNEFPNMVLHFEGSQDFIVEPDNLMVLVADNTFCVAIREIEGVSLFGAYQQKDHWISFDYTTQRLSFAPAECSRHA